MLAWITVVGKLAGACSTMAELRIEVKGQFDLISVASALSLFVTGESSRAVVATSSSCVLKSRAALPALLTGAPQPRRCGQLLRRYKAWNRPECLIRLFWF